MKKPAFLCLVLLLGLALLLSAGGCSSLLENDYLRVQPHREQASPLPGEEEIPEVSSYLTLKDAILDLVLDGEIYGLIRLSDFTTDEMEAMSMACWEVKNNTPYAAWAVDHITYEYTEILGYYDMEVYISYRRYQSQIDSLLALSTPSQMRAALRSAVRDYKTYLAISVSDSSIDEDFIRNYVEEYYYSNPAYMLSCPELELYTYPDSGIKRILEAFIQYPYPPEEMAQRLTTLNQTGQSILAETEAEAGAPYALALCRALTARCAYSPIPDPSAPNRSQPAYTAYGALLDGQANGEGYAMGYKLLCDLADIECYVVRGWLDGLPHAWNILKLDGDYYHVDPAMCDELGYEAAFLCRDEDLGDRYFWDREAYPACTGPLSYLSLLGEGLPTVPVDPENPEASPSGPVPPEENGQE